MPSWLRSLIHKGERPPRPPIVELLVLEGADAGQRFTLDGDEVMVGRRVPHGHSQRGVLLSDPTVSSKQAVIRRRGHAVLIQHLAGATNPTLIDGREAQGEPLRPGSRIQIGQVVMEVRVREGMSLSHLTQAFAVDPDARAALRDADSDTAEYDVAGSDSADRDTTEMRPVVSRVGELVVERGFEIVSDRRFPIWSTGTLLGRGADADVRLADIGVSRRHAELIWQGERLMLVHHSGVNATLLNGCEVLDQECIRDGDVIQLADRVSLRVELGRPADHRAAESGAELRRRTLKQEMEQKIDLDSRIEEQFSVQGSFLDVDIVNSYRMKSEATRAEHIIVSFERFRAFVGALVAEFGGHVLNSNGDELMCYFESTHDSVRAGSQILARLDDFNGRQNLLRVPFRFRIGIHTGKSLVDLDQGVAYSTVLDIAGHLQKLADENGLVISEQTFEALPEGLPFEHVGTMEREGFDYYRLTGSIE